MRTSATRNLKLLRGQLGELTEPAASEARRLLEREEELLEAFRSIVGTGSAACGSACTATTTWARCSTPETTSSSSISRASPRGR